MRHLTEAELVDRVDGTLAPSRNAHLESCDRCRAAVAELREVLARAEDVEISEPSPLFWEHFSARVRDGVRESAGGQRPEVRGRWVGAPALSLSPAARWALAGAVLTVVLVGTVWRASAPVPGRPATVTTASTSSAESPGAPDVSTADGLPDVIDVINDAFDPDTDAAWALVRTVADDLSWDDVAAEGAGVRPGSVERAMWTLSVDERSELVRLLQAETKQPGA